MFLYFIYITYFFIRFVLKIQLNGNNKTSNIQLKFSVTFFIITVHIKRMKYLLYRFYKYIFFLIKRNDRTI
jgi:hypothetical protein